MAASTGLPLTEARDHFEAQGARDALVEASGQLRTIAVGLHKICNDLRWMGSGPRAGLGELQLPDLQPGSSIMPGKVNPVIPEATHMVAAQVIGNDAAIAFAGASGNFELNVMLPVMARNLLESIRLLANVSRLLADRTIDGAVADEQRCRELAESSPSIVTPLNKYIGYENAAEGRQERAQGAQDDPPGRGRGRLRRARRPHRGAARRGARRAVDDAPLAELLRTRPAAARATAGAGHALPLRVPRLAPDTPRARLPPSRETGPRTFWDAATRRVSRQFSPLVGRAVPLTFTSVVQADLAGGGGRGGERAEGDDGEGGQQGALHGRAPSSAGGPSPPYTPHNGTSRTSSRA